MKTAQAIGWLLVGLGIIAGIVAIAMTMF